MRLRATAAVTALALLALPAATRAEPNPLAVDLRWDVPVVLGAGALAIGLSTKAVAPTRCRWCATNSFDTTLRDHLVWHDAKSAGTASDVLANGVLPAAALIHSGAAAWAYGDARIGLEDAIVIGEAALIATDLNAASKDAFARSRPGAGPGAGGAAAKSFYSGHTTIAFAVATATGTVASLRGYPSAPWVWATGLTLATGVGYLRVAADAHWTTDVLAGAAVSGVVGWAVPYLFHRVRSDRGRSAVEIVPAPGGLALVF
jgi:membrane-associated phospholipid phosphatase